MSKKKYIIKGDPTRPIGMAEIKELEKLALMKGGRSKYRKVIIQNFWFDTNLK